MLNIKKVNAQYVVRIPAEQTTRLEHLEIITREVLQTGWLCSALQNLPGVVSSDFFIENRLDGGCLTFNVAAEDDTALLHQRISDLVTGWLNAADRLHTAITEIEGLLICGS